MVEEENRLLMNLQPKMEDEGQEDQWKGERVPLLRKEGKGGKGCVNRH